MVEAQFAGGMSIRLPRISPWTVADLALSGDDGNTYEAVDARAVERGGKEHAVELFSRNNPFGLTCWLEGPFTS